MARATRGLETRSSRADSVNRSVNQTPRNGLRREDAAVLKATRAVCTPRSAWPPETARDARRMAHNPAMHDPVSESRQSRVVLLAARLSRPSPPCQGQAARGPFASLDPASSARGWQLSRRTGATRARPSAQAGAAVRRAISGPLTQATSGLSRSLADSPSRRSGRPTGARTVQIPKLIVRVRFPSPAPQHSRRSVWLFRHVSDLASGADLGPPGH